MLAITTLIAIVVFVMTLSDFDSYSFERNVDIVISRHTSGEPAKPEEFFEYHGPNFDTYWFTCKGEPAEVKACLGEIEIPNYTASLDWGIGNCGYSDSRILTNKTTGATLFQSITYVPIGKYNKITFVWHKNGDDAG